MPPHFASPSLSSTHHHITTTQSRLVPTISSRSHTTYTPFITLSSPRDFITRRYVHISAPYRFRIPVTCSHPHRFVAYTSAARSIYNRSDDSYRDATYLNTFPASHFHFCLSHPKLSPLSPHRTPAFPRDTRITRLTFQPQQTSN